MRGAGSGLGGDLMEFIVIPSVCICFAQGKVLVSRNEEESYALRHCISRIKNRTYCQ